MSKYSCPNAGIVTRIIREMGGTVDGIIPSGTKHIRLRAVTAQGNSFIVTMSKGKSDPIAMENWTRQAFNRADNRSNST